MPKRKQIQRAEEPTVPVAPMLDMAFQLLTFFILTFKPLPTEGQFVMNLLPAQPATAMSAEAPSEATSDQLPASLRTLPTVLKAGQGGMLSEITVGEQVIPTDQAALEKELDKYLQDPNLPFDQTLLKVDPNLKYSEVMKVVNAFSNAFIRAKKEPNISFDQLQPGEAQ
ncbi:MAG: ExbD/TolR family protein [Isosphaeraceae bacterium]